MCWSRQVCPNCLRRVSCRSWYSDWTRPLAKTKLPLDWCCTWIACVLNNHYFVLLCLLLKKGMDHPRPLRPILQGSPTPSRFSPYQRRSLWQGKWLPEFQEWAHRLGWGWPRQTKPRYPVRARWSWKELHQDLGCQKAHPQEREVKQKK